MFISCFMSCFLKHDMKIDMSHDKFIKSCHLEADLVTKSREPSHFGTARLVLRVKTCLFLLSNMKGEALYF